MVHILQLCCSIFVKWCWSLCCFLFVISCFLINVKVCWDVVVEFIGQHFDPDHIGKMELFNICEILRVAICEIVLVHISQFNLVHIC